MEKQSSQLIETAESQIAEPSEPASRRSLRPSKRRTDIQGLRAILMGQVLLFHAWKIGSPIGVDSFIMVSAYLMTSSFLRRTERGSMPFFVERWGNTFKRLLPPLVVVVLGTLGASLLLLPGVRWREITIQSFASITYWENWRLAAVSADYYADNHALSSPLQHLWSMSMQGQVFIIWPLLMTICVLLARKLNRSPRVTVAVAFALLTAASLLWLLFLSPDNASVYFDTRSRIWEFAFGSMVAAMAPWMRLPKRLSVALSYVALTVLIVFCLVSIGTYPGPMAFFPMISVSVLLLYIPNASGTFIEKFLGARPLAALGDVSYAVYLVHWPIFVLYLAYAGKEQLGALDGIALIAISVLLGWVLTKLVDDPLRKLPWSNRSTRNKYGMIAIWLVIGLVPVGGVYLWINARTAQLEQQANAAFADQMSGYSESDDRLDEIIPKTGPGSDAHPGARILLGSAKADFKGIEPIPDSLTVRDQHNYDGPCPAEAVAIIGEAQAKLCSSLGDFDTAEKRLFVAGSSHAQQLPMWQLTPLVEVKGWAATSILKGGCPWTMPGYGDDVISADCQEHNQQILDFLEDYQPDIAFVIVSWTDYDSTNEILIPGMKELVEELTQRGITVIGLGDNLRSNSDMYLCSDSAPANQPYGGCLYPEADHFADDSIMDPLLDIDGFHFVDMRDAYCIDGACPTIIGNIIVYFDTNHVTKTYSLSVAPFFSQRVLDALDQPATVSAGADD